MDGRVGRLVAQRELEVEARERVGRARPIAGGQQFRAEREQHRVGGGGLARRQFVVELDGGGVIAGGGSRFGFMAD